MGIQARRLLATHDAECNSVEQHAAATAEAFAQHPDYQIIISFPGLADLSGARVLGEIGDDRTRFAANARALNAFADSHRSPEPPAAASSSPTAGSKTPHLAAAGFVWTFAALTASPGARADYDRPRAASDVCPNLRHHPRVVS